MGFLQDLFGNRSSALKQFINDGAVIIDVRTPYEYNSGHIKGSRNVPLDVLQSKWEEVRKLNKPVITVCHSGMRSNSAKTFLEAKGLKVINGGSWAALNKIL